MGCSPQLSVTLSPPLNHPHPNQDEHSDTQAFPSLPAPMLHELQVSPGKCHQKAHPKSCWAVIEGKRRGDKGHCFQPLPGGQDMGPAPNASPAHTGGCGHKESYQPGAITDRPCATQLLRKELYSTGVESVPEDSVSTALPACPSWAPLQRCLLQHLTHPSLKHLL